MSPGVPTLNPRQWKSNFSRNLFRYSDPKLIQIFFIMKAEYCETKHTHANIKKHLLEIIDLKIHKVLQNIPQHRYSRMEDLHDLLHKRKTIGGLQHSLKHAIFTPLFQQELKEFNFIKSQDQYTLKVIKLTKCKVKDLKIDWREIIGKLEASDKETNKLTGLYQFLRIVRDYYDDNNAMEVFDHFLGNYKFSDEITWIYMEHFVNLTKKTKPEIALQLLKRLRDLYHYDKVKDICYYRWLLRIKRKLPQLPLDEYLDDLNNEILNELILFHNDEKGMAKSLSSKFLVEILAKFIGKTNPKSVEMVNWFFKISESSFSAFEDSKNGIKLLKNFLAPLWKRKTREDALRKKLEKKDEEEDIDDKDKEKDKEEEEKEKDDSKEGLENMIGAFVLMAESDEDEDQDEEVDDTLPIAEREQIRQDKLATLVSDQLTPEIMTALKAGLEKILQDVFFASSKEGSKLLKYIYFLFPDLAERSIEYVNKGMDIDELNFGLLMKNTKKIVQYLFVFGDREKLLDNILSLLGSISKIRYVKDAWNVVGYITMKIPLLDEDDYKDIPEETKQIFQKNFKIQHDLFYEKYSETVFELFKRFLKETEAKEKKTLLRQDNPYLGIAYNVSPEFDKRVLEVVISNYIENPNPFIYNYLELKRIPEKHLENFTPEIRKNLSEEQAYTKFHELLVASKSLPFDRLTQILNDIAQNDSPEHYQYVQQIVTTYISENIQIHLKIKPIDSSLNYLWDTQATYTYDLENTDLQSVEDSLRKLLAVWRENYDEVMKFVDAHKSSLEGELNLVETVKRFYFETGKPDFEIRKQILWRIELMEAIIEKLPYEYLVWSETPTLKDLTFKQFPLLKEAIIKSGQLIHDLLKIFLKELPHEYKIIARLQSFALLFVRDDVLEIAAIEFKDIVKVIKANESVDYTNLYLTFLKETSKFIVYNNAYHYFHQDKTEFNKMIPMIELANLHPDESEVGAVTRQEDFNIFQLLVEVLKSGPPPGTDDNKVKLFHSKLSKELAALLELPRNKTTPEILVQILTLTIGFIVSPERTIREGYLKTLKNILIIMEDVRVDENTLEAVSKGLLSSTSKQTIVWAIGLIFLKDTITNYDRFYVMLNQLLFSDDFLLRKYSQFLLSYLIRSDRKKNTKVTVLESLGEYKPKSLDEFLESGYLRPEHVLTNMKKKKVHMKYRSYDKCVIKEKFNHKESLSFIFDKEKALKFVQQYQTDQVSSEDEILLKKKTSTRDMNELSDIFSWLKGRYSKVVDLAEHRFTSYESIFGQRFFKYIFEIDYENGFPFFHATKEFMETVCLPNLQTLDNQVVAINYISMLLQAYSKFYIKIPSEEVEAFILKAMTDIIEKSSGTFFNVFRRLSLSSIDQMPFLVKFFEKYSPTHSGFYRTVEIRLSWFSHKRQQLIEILQDIFKSGNNLHNNNVSKLIKQVILFNEKHFFNRAEIEECHILDLAGLEAKGEIIRENESIYTASRKQFDDILIENLKSLISSDQIENRKSGTKLLYESIDTYFELEKTPQSLEVVKVLLNLAVDIVISNKEEFKTEQNYFENTLSLLLCQPYPHDQFVVLMEPINKLLTPLPQVGAYLKTLYKNPYNFFQLTPEEYNAFISRILSLLESTVLFKEVLTTLSGLFYFKKPFDNSESIGKLGANERETMTLYMALLLSDARNLSKYERELGLIVGSKEKDKVKAWAKMMVNSRGKREILQSEQVRRIWGVIVGVSNPYFYHA